MRNAARLSLVLCCAAAACGREPPAQQPKPPAPAPAPVPQAKPPAPEAPKSEPPKSEALKPAEPSAPVPAARVTKDAKGQEWASHMGDIAFTFDLAAATKRAESGHRALMLYFTSPS